MGPGMILASAFLVAQVCLAVALVSLLVWLAPPGLADAAFNFVDPTSLAQQQGASLFYALTVLFIEPFYVAAGFGLYLNRRAELEAWDIEQEFRRAFAA